MEIKKIKQKLIEGIESEEYVCHEDMPTFLGKELEAKIFQEFVICGEDDTHVFHVAITKIN